MAVEKLSIKANMIWNSMGSMVYLACQWLVTVFVVRLASGYDAAGLLSLAMAVTGIFGTFANYKMGTYQISDIHHENTLAEYLGFRCLMLFVSAIACVVYSFFTCPAQALSTVILFYLFKAVGLMIDVLHGSDQQHRRMDYIGKSFILQGSSTLAAFVAVFWATQDLNIAIVAMMVAAMFVLVLFDIPHTAQFERFSIKITWRKAAFFLKTSFPAVIASIAASALFTIPKQYLSMSMGAEALGIYSSVAAPALIIQMGATYLYGPLLDVFPRIYFDGDLMDFMKLLGRTVLSIIGVAMACSFILELVGEWVLVLLFGQSVSSYVYLLQPVLLSTALTAFLWFFGDLLIAMRDFRANFIGNLIAFVSVLPLSLVCIDVWGMNGVSFAGAMACFAGIVVLVFFLLLDVRKEMNKTERVGFVHAEAKERE